MHHCLTVQDIVVQIAEELRDVERGHATLAAMARTSHTFTDAALDALWYSQDGLGNLFGCFPARLWGHKGDQDATPRGISGVRCQFDR